MPNVLKLTIRNEGSATANGVVITISGAGSTANTNNNINANSVNSSSGSAGQSSSPSTINLGLTTFNVGTIIAGRNATIDPVVYPSLSSAGTVQNFNLGTSYNDAYGNKKTSNQLIGLQIIPSSPQSSLSVSPSSYFSPSSSSSLASTTAVAFPSSSDNNSNTNIDPGHLSPSAAPSSTSPSTILITAGKVQDLKFTINNNNNPSTGSTANSITNLAISLDSQSSSVRILGPSSWNLQNIRPQSTQELSTQAFASTSLIGNPIFFTVNIQYIQNGNQVKTASFNLGAIVVGDIKITANDVTIRYIGDTPYLVGNLLNEGNTPASFTNVEMLSQGQVEATRQRQQTSPSATSISSPSSSTSDKSSNIILVPVSSEYVGNLAENSPVSFSIPLKIVQVPTTAGGQKTGDNVLTQNTTITRSTMVSSSFASPSITIDGNSNNTTPGTYPVSLKITYSDDLRNSHELILNKTISFEFEQTQSDNPSQQQQQLMMQQPIPNNGFIDSYWAADTSANDDSTANGNSSSVGSSTLPPPRQELGPGDGQGTLAIVLSNTGFSDINGIVGYLALPPGFSATSDSTTTINNNHNNANSIPNQQQQQQIQPLQEAAIAGLSNVVKSGETYTLYFRVNILRTATVGTHSASLILNYFKVPELEPGKYSSETFTIPFTLPGKVILDAIPKVTDLTPGASNEPKIQIENRGTADAHGVIATVIDVSGNSITSNVGNNNNLNGASNSSTGEITTTTTTTTSPSSIPTVNLGA
ncbi:MAG: hypothetical protein M3247_09295, partial [Thermoproteota archaeon]|nr:hypothetical protein [Thermoproteota archaeon]